MRKQNDGSYAQDLAQQAFVLLESSSRFSWLRLHDSKSAGIGAGGNFIPEQYADYTVINRGHSALVEVKSSVTYRALDKCPVRSYFKDIQILGARMWKRAGGSAYCLFYSEPSKMVELWDMQPIIDAYLSEPRHRAIRGNRLALMEPKPLPIAESLKIHLKGLHP